MYDSIEQIIAEKGIYTGLTRGTSMWPLIHQGRDNIIIVRPRGRLKKYDVPVYKDGKRYVDCQNSRRYRLYSRVWVALYPVRPLIMFVHKGYGWIRRHIFKRGERS